jgi:hypothetical protein
VAQRVAEHARPLDARGLSDVPKGNLDMLAARAESLRGRAPFAPRMPYARAAREQRLRHYLASFGIEVPPRVDGEREKTEEAMAAALEKLCADKARPSIVHVWGPPPGKNGAVGRSLRRLRARRAEVRWTVPSFDQSVGKSDAAPGVLASVRDVVEDAVRLRARVSRARAERQLRRLGAKPQVVLRKLVLPVTAAAPPAGEIEAPPPSRADVGSAAQVSDAASRRDP